MAKINWKSQEEIEKEIDINKKEIEKNEKIKLAPDNIDELKKQHATLIFELLNKGVL